MTAITLLCWSGCPSHPAARADLESALAELGHADLPIEIRWVESEEDAERERFVGSPTIRIDGVDVDPAPEEIYGLTCRVYRRLDNRFSPLPDRQRLRERLSAAFDREENS